MINEDKIAVMPNMGDYNVPVKILIERCLNYRVINCPATTKRTVELGSKYSPDTICTPYKIIMGNFIEALEKTRANVLLMPGIACRLGLYDVLHKRMLEDMGYEFEMLVLFDYAANAGRLYKSLASYNPGLTEEKYYEVFNTVARIVLDMDELADFMRRNAAFEIQKGEFSRCYNMYLSEAGDALSEADAEALGNKYREVLKSIKVDKPQKPIRIALVGDLYSTIEPHGNCHIEKWLTDNGVEILRKTNLTSISKALLSTEGINGLIEKSGGYLNYHIGGVANTTIAFAHEFTLDGADGIIHMKGASCSPEITAMSLLQNISKDYDIPIIYFTFDTETSEAGLHTRLEAFIDMLKMKGAKISI